MREQVRQMADRTEHEKDRQRVHRAEENSPVIEKGLAARNHALLADFDKIKKNILYAESAFCGGRSPKRMSGKEKRALFGDMDIVMTGFAGLYGSVVLARERDGELQSRYPVFFLEEAKGQERLIWQIPEAAPAGKSDDCGTYSFTGKGIAGMYLLSEGGVFAGLWSMGELAGVGLEIYIKKIPVKQETVEICNFFDVNPYQMNSEGSCLLLTKNGGRLRERLRAQGISSEVIGFTTDNNDRVVINGEEQRFLEKHYEDALALLGREGKK